MDFKTPYFLDKKLFSVWDKVTNAGRLDLDDVRLLYGTTDVIGAGWMANQVKEARYGKKAFYV